MSKLRNFLVDICKKNKTIRKIARKLYQANNEQQYKKFYKKYDVDDKIILFEAFGGRNYTCSPKAIYEKMITMKEFQDYKMVWAFTEPEKHEEYSNKNTLYWKYLNTPLSSVDLSQLIKENNDTVGWIIVKNTNVNYPVVQTSNNDLRALLDSFLNGGMTTDNKVVLPE